VLNAQTSAGHMSKMNGSTFSPGFNATYALEMNITDLTPNTNNTFFVDQYNLVQNTATFLGSFALTSGVGTSAESGSSETAISVGVTNTNTAGVVASGSSTTQATAANQANAQAVTTGVELGIPLATLGNPTGSIEVMAGINGSSDSGLSNQMLPGLPVGSYDVKAVPSGTITNPYYFSGANGLGFNFSSLANEYITVPNTVVANGNWLPAGGGVWSDPDNWSNSAVPNALGASASFSTATANSQITLDISPTVGTLNFNNTNSYTIASSTTESLTFDNGGSSATAALNDFGGVHYISAPLVLNSSLTVTCENHGDAMYVSGDISGVGGLNVSNSGIYMTTFSALVLSGTDTYQGPTDIERGELQLASEGALPLGTSLSIVAASPHGVLDLNSYDATVSSLSATAAGAAIINSSANTNTATFTYAGINTNPSTFPGSISDNFGAGGSATALTVASGSLTLTGTNTYAGNTQVNNGATLEFSSATSSGMTFPSNGNVVNNGALVLNDSVTVGTISGSGATTVTAGQFVTINNISQAHGVDNEGQLTVLTGGTIGGITQTGTAGEVQLESGTLQIAPNSPASVQSYIYVAAGAIDITNNRFYINYGPTGSDPISQIVQWIYSGAYGGGTTISWTGGGIISSTAQTNPNYGIGYADYADPGNPAGLSSGQIELMYTLLGDANLDGKVNGTDFNLMATNFNQAVTNGWDEGDFNYDGKVNGNDFVLLADNFNQFANGSSPSASDIAALDAFAAANGISLQNVPEPACIGLMAMAGLGILRRRRRR
jgi:autotransporter-associated beta strand protein